MPQVAKVLHFGYDEEKIFVTQVEVPTEEELEEGYKKNKKEVSDALARLPGVVIPLALITDRSKNYVV